MNTYDYSILTISIVLLVSPLVTAVLTIALISTRGSVRNLEKRLAGVPDLDTEIARLIASRDACNLEISALRSLYQEKKSVYDRLLADIAVCDDRLEFAEMGIYEPHFDFTDSEAYKLSIIKAREQQKSLISDGAAVICTTNWTVDGSSAKGKTLTKRNIRLTLRAFNNECDAAIASARWNNVNAMEKRILRAREQIDKLNSSNSIFVTKEFLASKLHELYLTHEHREKLKPEREERAEAARSAREEQRLIRDMEAAQADEERYMRLLEKAKAEAASIVGPKLEAFNEQIKFLERDLADARAKAQRAQAMAERTRTGYVYVISNIGSFGGDVVKIGLTRRLDPMDRVRELGDASVPFVFDTHAIIYSDDAPALERALHGEFDNARINAQNYRKEFFKVSLEVVEAAVGRFAPGAPFFKNIEAQEFRETVAKRRADLAIMELRSDKLFPASI